MNQQYSKGWTDRSLWSAFKDAVAQADCAEIAAVVRAQNAERLPVDAFIHAMPENHRRAARTQNEAFPDFESEEFVAELDQVIELSGMREEKLSDLPLTLPKGMRVLSPMLAEEQVKRYTPGKDYGVSDWKNIQSGQAMGDTEWNGLTDIRTVRDAASYVHADNPLTPFIRAVAYLLSVGAEQKMSSEMDTRFAGQGNFMCYGMPFFLGMLGEALREGGFVSFKAKWTNFRMRPEEAAIQIHDQPLSLTYAEGSPMHPAMPAMHSFAAWVQMYLLLAFFKGDHVLPSGETVEEFLKLLCDNIGYFRVFAGVHYPSDHTAYRNVAAAVAASVAAPYLR